MISISDADPLYKFPHWPIFHIASFSWNKIFRFSIFLQKKGIELSKTTLKVFGYFCDEIDISNTKKKRFPNVSVLSMLVTDVGDEKCR